VKFTGERYLPEVDGPEISYEHWHRYLYAAQFVAAKRVLDVASGEGFGSDLLAATAEHVIGVDSDPETIAHASKTYRRSNLEFLCGSAEAIPLTSEHTFDVVVSYETIEHLAEQQQRRFGAEIKRVLKPNGICIISTPNKLHYSDEANYNNPFHVREYYEAEFVSYLRCFFQMVYILGQRVYPTSYIWSHTATTQQSYECQIAFSDGRFQPVSGDQKELRYMIAVCSDTELTVPSNSVLLDISERAIRFRLQQLAEKERVVQCQRGEIEAIQQEQAAQRRAAEEQQALQRGLWELARERDALQRDVFTLRQQQAAAKRATLERRIAALADERETLTREVVDLREVAEKQAEMDCRLQELTEANEAAERELAHLREVARDRAAMDRQLQELIQANEAAEAELARLRAAAQTQAEMSCRLQELTQANEAAEREVSELRRTVAEQAEQLTALTTHAEPSALREQELRELLVDAHQQLLRRDVEIEATLGAMLRHRAPIVPRTIRHQNLIEQVRAVARASLPENANILVVSLGDDAFLHLDGLHAWPFPQAADGTSADYSLPNGLAAIDHLEALRAQGADFLLVPHTGVGWLATFPELQQHLERRHRLVARRPNICTIFALSD
jgi:2-polyprenyl-3-methyl-5-hydroxy-6-metoxy-1,4-benzoquinol methylase